MQAGFSDTVFDIYASLKFSGPAFPNGKSDELNAVWCDRIVLVPIQFTEQTAP